MRIWDTATGLELQKFQIFNPNHGLALWSPSEDRIYAASNASNAIRLFKFSSALASIPGVPGVVSGARWSLDGRQFGRGKADGTVVVWDTETLGERFTLDSGTSYPGFTSWSPTGDRILTVNFDGTTRIWDASSGSCCLILPVMKTWCSTGSGRQMAAAS